MQKKYHKQNRLERNTIQKCSKMFKRQNRTKSKEVISKQDRTGINCTKRRNRHNRLKLSDSQNGHKGKTSKKWQKGQNRQKSLRGK